VPAATNSPAVQGFVNAFLEQQGSTSTGTLQDVEGAVDVLDPAVAVASFLLVSSAESVDEVAVELSALAASYADTGVGTEMAAILSDEALVRSILAQLLQEDQDALTGRRLLNNVGSLSSQRLEDIGSTDPAVYAVIGGMLAAAGVAPTLVQFYAMKANAVGLLLASSNAGSAAINGDATTVTAALLASAQAPGDVAWRALGQGVTTAQITDLLLGCQAIALTDDLEYSGRRSRAAREQAMAADVGVMMTALNLPHNELARAASGDIVVYIPSAAFRRCYAAKVARTGSLDAEDVTVSLVATFTDPAVAQIQTVVFYTARLQRSNRWARCFLCDEREYYSSETDSEESSSTRASSSDSSSQTNFKDAERYQCIRTSEAECGDLSYAIHLSEFMFTKGCKRCGAWITSCPDHSSQADAFSSEQATLRFFKRDGEALREAEAARGGTLIDRFLIPNRKVYYERFGSGGDSDSAQRYSDKMFEFKGTRVVIPVKPDDHDGEL